MRKIGVFIAAVIVFSVFVSAFSDLSDFPGMFINNGNVNALIVIGRHATAEDVYGAIELATMIQYESAKSVDFIKIERLNIARFDDEIDDIYAQNLIIVGGPCVNAVAAKLLEYPVDCMDGFSPGEAVVKLKEHKNGNTALLVAGATGLDTVRAARVLAHYDDPSYNLTGKEVPITGYSVIDVGIVNK